MSTDGRVSSDQVSSERRSGEIVLVAAVAANEVIGADGAMPWHLPEDLAHFKEVTMGHPMVMGRKTFEAIGRPLPGRRTIVVTRDRQWAHSGVQTAGDLDTALALAFEGVRAGPDPTGPVMVVGGGQIYEQAMPQATRLEITHIDAEPPGDTRFPRIDRRIWRETERDDRDGYAFVRYVRLDPADAADAVATP